MNLGFLTPRDPTLLRTVTPKSESEQGLVELLAEAVSSTLYGLYGDKYDD